MQEARTTAADYAKQAAEHGQHIEQLKTLLEEDVSMEDGKEDDEPDDARKSAEKRKVHSDVSAILRDDLSDEKLHQAMEERRKALEAQRQQEEEYYRLLMAKRGESEKKHKGEEKKEPLHSLDWYR